MTNFKLPVELLGRIFSHLPDQDARNVGWLIVTGVCCQWRDVALSSTSWPLQLQIVPERAHQEDVKKDVAKLYWPLPVHMAIEEISLDMMHTPANSWFWTHTFLFIELLSNRIRYLHVQLR